MVHPDEKKRDRKSHDEQKKDGPRDPRRQVENRSYIVNELEQKPRHNRIGGGDTIDVLAFQFCEEVSDAQPLRAA